jgi:hypothetical protein
MLAGRRAVLLGCGAGTAVMIAVLVVVVRFVGPSVRPEANSNNELRKLLALPYVAFSQTKATDRKSGVVLHIEGESWPGLNLYCSMTSPAAYLMDMTGNVVHAWNGTDEDFNLWEHGLLAKGGGLVVIDKFQRLMRLDADSRVEWEIDGRFHHDVSEKEDGGLVAIEQEQAYHRGFNAMFDAIVEISPTGDRRAVWKTREHLDEMLQTFDNRSFFDTVAYRENALEWARPLYRRLKWLMLGQEPATFDYFHVNTVNVLPENALGARDERFEAGNLLVCFRNVNQIAILDRESKDFVWIYGEGVLEWPHHPTMLEDGNILVFDNGVKRQYSRVVEINPEEEKIVWEYASKPRESFYSFQKGSAQRLPNGNTLICEGDRGRAFEIDREGQVVWEWRNPRMKDGYRETVYRMIRIRTDEAASVLYGR